MQRPFLGGGPPRQERSLATLTGAHADYSGLDTGANPRLMPKETQSLGVAGRLFPDIAGGQKTSTIRWREAPVALGPLVFASDEDPSETILVAVTRCSDMPLSEAASFLGRSEDWPDDVMLAGMREHYPEIELSSIVQIVEFERVATA